jgi:hypothetical protein
MIRYLPLIICLLSSSAIAEVYRWTDADGQIHYSDRPHEGAEEVSLPPAQTFSAPVVQRSRSTTEDAEADDASKYKKLSITSPADGQADWDIPGDVAVNLSLSPKLQRGHTVLLFMDGDSVGSSSSGDLTFRLTGVLRGTHSLRAAVQDDSGKSLIQSSPVSFTVHKTSILNPNNPNNIPPAVPTPFSGGGL